MFVGIFHYIIEFSPLLKYLLFNDLSRQNLDKSHKYIKFLLTITHRFDFSHITYRVKETVCQTL